jgi:hypothetical protein
MILGRDSIPYRSTILRGTAVRIPKAVIFKMRAVAQRKADRPGDESKVQCACIKKIKSEEEAWRETKRGATGVHVREEGVVLMVQRKSREHLLGEESE